MKNEYWKQRCELSEVLLWYYDQFVDPSGIEKWKNYRDDWKSLVNNPPEDKPKRSKKEIFKVHFPDNVYFNGYIHELELRAIKCMEEYASQVVELPSNEEMMKKFCKDFHVYVRPNDKWETYQTFDTIIHDKQPKDIIEWMRDYIKNQMNTK
jgi:hypothetical protein